MKDALQVGGAASVRLDRADQILGGPERIKAKFCLGFWQTGVQSKAAIKSS